ncbi:Hypothetical protein, putative [Bodo saltans]|uniref:Uncharacterized protein n=1 Tax=Bodo saltans TaxID=75058 RepID=A0A0S4J3Y7_BODSA|nr:Hypothetical protein, putative [Bodo saltans]|eukprot:CUG74493.1 Hypothetical protein, putative [Bodo saltans]
MSQNLGTIWSKMSCFLCPQGLHSTRLLLSPHRADPSSAKKKKNTSETKRAGSSLHKMKKERVTLKSEIALLKYEYRLRITSYHETSYASIPRPKGLSTAMYYKIRGMHELDYIEPMKLESIQEKELRIKAVDEDIWLRNPVPFSSVLEACDFLRDESPVMNSVEPTLSGRMYRFNATKIEGMLFSGIRKLTALALKDATVSKHFLIAVLGGSGLGKTDTLHRIRRDGTLRGKIAEHVSASSDGRMPCQHCVALFASFNESTPFDQVPYDAATEPNVTAALCNMLLSHYLGVECSLALTRWFTRLTLEDVVNYVQQREAAMHNCALSAVCVVVLVDEVGKLGDVRAKQLCDELLAVQHSSMRAGLPIFAVAAGLEVDSMFATVTRSSKHRLHPVTLSPCSP